MTLAKIVGEDPAFDWCIGYPDREDTIKRVIIVAAQENVSLDKAVDIYMDKRYPIDLGEE